MALSEDESRGFSASKDGTIVHWDVDSGKTEKYTWPSEDVLKSHGVKDPQGRATKHSKHVLALAVSSDGRYLATGGLDRHVHLWDIRTRKHIQVCSMDYKPGIFNYFYSYKNSSKIIVLDIPNQLAYFHLQIAACCSVHNLNVLSNGDSLVLYIDMLYFLIDA